MLKRQREIKKYIAFKKPAKTALTCYRASLPSVTPTCLYLFLHPLLPCGKWIFIQLHQYPGGRSKSLQLYFPAPPKGRTHNGRDFKTFYWACKPSVYGLFSFLPLSNLECFSISQLFSIILPGKYIKIFIFGGNARFGVRQVSGSEGEVSGIGRTQGQPSALKSGKVRQNRASWIVIFSVQATFRRDSHINPKNPFYA